jgi:hypothetical protein
MRVGKLLYGAGNRSRLSCAGVTCAAMYTLRYTLHVRSGLTLTSIACHIAWRAAAAAHAPLHLLLSHRVAQHRMASAAALRGEAGGWSYVMSAVGILAH